MVCVVESEVAEYAVVGRSQGATLRRVVGVPRISFIVRRILADGLMAAVGLPVAYWLRFHAFGAYVPGGRTPDLNSYVQATPILVASLLLVFYLTGSYRYQRGVIFVDELFTVLRSMATAGVAILAAISLAPPDHLAYSRLTFTCWLAATSLLIGCSRYAISNVEKRQRARGIGAERALIVGSGPAATKLIQRIRMFPEFGYALVGVLTNDKTIDARVANVDVLGPVEAMAQTVNRLQVDIVFIALPQRDHESIVKLLSSNRRSGVEFRIVPSTLEMITSQIEPDQLAGIPLLRVLKSLDSTPPRVAAKRLFDIVLSSVALVLLAPIMIGVAIAVKLTSHGPILYAQERLGVDNRSFPMLKFRSMGIDAETEMGPVWAIAGDPRRTTVGRFLRRFSLDELPQLWNVLKGEMSLVGPRPERPVFADDFLARLPRYGERHRIRPGITGWAQVNDLRGMSSVEDRLIYDLYYVERWSLSFDLKILLTTGFRILTSKNSY